MGTWTERGKIGDYRKFDEKKKKCLHFFLSFPTVHSHQIISLERVMEVLPDELLRQVLSYAPEDLSSIAACNKRLMVAIHRSTRSLQGVRHVLACHSFALILRFDLCNTSLQAIPDQLCHLNRLECLLLSRNHIAMLPSWLFEFRHLKELNLARNRLTSISSSLAQLRSLEHLDMSSNPCSFPDAACNTLSLKSLILAGCRITVLPEEIGSLGELQTLNLEYNPLSVLPKGFSRLVSLETLILDCTSLTDFPIMSISCLVSLKVLSMGYIIDGVLNWDGVAFFGNMTELDLSSTGLSEIPNHLFCIVSLRKLRMSDNRLPFFQVALAP